MRALTLLLRQLASSQPCICCTLYLQWDKTENKTGVVLYGAGGIVLIWLSSALITAINSVPLVSNSLACSCYNGHIIAAAVGTCFDAVCLDLPVYLSCSA